MFFTPKRRPTAHRLLGRQGRDTRTRREHAAALTVTGAVQVALAAALLAAAWMAFQAVQAHARDVEASLRLALPALFAAGAGVTARSAVRNLRLARHEREAAADRGNPSEPSRGDPGP